MEREVRGEVEGLRGKQGDLEGPVNEEGGSGERGSYNSK